MTKSEIKSKAERRRNATTDPVLLMLGVGKPLWSRESGDNFFDRLRSEDAPPPVESRLDATARNPGEFVWQRIKDHQREEFKTATGKPLTYVVEGDGVWFFRGGASIESCRENKSRSRLHVVPSLGQRRSTT